MNDHAIEQEIQAKGLTAPRITTADIEANIASEHYINAAAGAIASLSKSASDDQINAIPSSLCTITICILILCNGYRIVGVNEGPVSVANFDEELGRKLAREKAVDQIWPLMGYELRSKLAELERRDAMIDEIAAGSSGQQTAD